MKKSTYLLALLATAASLVFTIIPLPASETDDRIESSAKESYVFISDVYGVKMVVNKMTIE